MFVDRGMRNRDDKYGNWVPCTALIENQSLCSAASAASSVETRVHQEIS